MQQARTELCADGRGWVLCMVSLGWFLSMGVRLIYPVILPQLVAEYQITYGTAGLSLSLLWVSYAAVNTPAGMLADYFGERLLLVVSMVLSLLGIIAVIASQTFLQFLLSTIVLGAGTGLFGTTGTTVLTDVYTRHDTTAISLSQIAGSLGSIVLPVIAGLLAVALGWRVGLAYAAPGFVIVCLGLWLSLPARTSPVVDSVNQHPGDILRNIQDTFSNRALLLVVGGLTAVGVVYQGITGFLPMYLIDIKGFTQQEATLFFGVLFVAMIVGKIVSGPLANRLGNRATLIGYSAVSLPGFVLLPVVDSTILILVSVWFTGLILGYTPVATTYALELIPGDVQGSVFGIIRTTFLGTGALAPPVIGYLADVGLFDLAFASFVIFAILGVVLSYFLPSDR